MTTVVNFLIDNLISTNASVVKEHTRTLVLYMYMCVQKSTLVAFPALCKMTCTKKKRGRRRKKGFGAER